MNGVKIMWNFLTELIKSLPAEFQMTLISALFILGLVLAMAALAYLPRIRRDKDGRWYFRDAKYEDSKRDMRKIIDGFEKIRAELQDVRLDQKRFIIYMPEFSPGERCLALALYLDAGGNGETRDYGKKNLTAKYPDVWAAAKMIVKKAAKGGRNA